MTPTSRSASPTSASSPGAHSASPLKLWFTAARPRTLPAAVAPVLVGNASLTRRYQLALSTYGLAATVPPSDAAWPGLHRIAQALELPA